MKKLLLVFLLCLPWGNVFGQGTSAAQNARRIISGTAAPNAPCRPGPPWTDFYIRTTTGVVYYCADNDPLTWTPIPVGSGDVSAAAVIADNAVVRGDGGAKGVQSSTVTIADTTGNMAGVGTLNTHTIPGGTGTFALTSQIVPGGSNTQVQFNDSSAFGGDAGLVYNKTTDLLTVVDLSATNTVVAGSSVRAVNNITVGATSLGAALRPSSVNGRLILTNAGALNAFDMLQFGADTAGFPALKRSGTGLMSRLADDSADAPFTSLNLTAPTVYGGSAVGSTFTINGTSNASPVNAHVSINPVVGGAFPGAVFIGAPTSAVIIGDALHLQSADAAGTTLTIDNYGGGIATNTPAIIFRRANGTSTTPAATASGDVIANLNSRGYQTTTNAFTLATARIRFFADEAFTSTTVGTSVVIETAPVGSTTVAERLRVGNGGIISLNSAVFYSPGTPGIAGNGTLNANSRDSAGRVTTNATGASTIVLTFANTFTRAPACGATNETTANLLRASCTTTTLTLSGTIVSGDVVSYTAIGY